MCYTSAATCKHFFLSGKDNQAAAKEQAVNAAKEALEVSRHEYEKVLRRQIVSTTNILALFPCYTVCGSCEGDGATTARV